MGSWLIKPQCSINEKRIGGRGRHFNITLGLTLATGN